MPTYMTPGVYVEEVPSQSKPIEGVGTSVAAFVGLAPYGPLNEPVQCSNWGQFARTFGNPLAPAHGPFMENAYLAHAVYGYFHNGGSLCWVVRVGPDRVSKAPQLPLAVEGDEAPDEPLFFVAALESVEHKVTVDLEKQTYDEKNPPPPTAPGKEPEQLYQLTVHVDDGREPPEPEVHKKLSVYPGENSIVSRVNADSKYVRVLRTDTATAAPPLPKGLTFTEAAGGELTAKPEADLPKALEPGAVEGDAAKREGLGALAAIDAVTMVCVPDIMTFADDALSEGSDDNADWVAALQKTVMSHCDKAGDRMAILDPPPAMAKPDEVYKWQQGAGLDSKFATLYYPWIEVLDPISKALKPIPPCGHMAGIWARTDATRGVHKAPANEVVQGASKLAFEVSQVEQGDLNRAGINCIRSFPGRGIRVWGARTLSSDPEWRYINVRRLFNFVSESILEGTQWAVFEPNDMRLWTQLRIATTNFLTRVWRDGALFGATPGEAFYVKCDAETNPPDLVEAGQVTVEIGIAPVKPAEFIVFRISQFQAGEAG
jgi:uncharacterized protein